ncbi:MAG: GGDEF domain-containing protein [Candidatus Eisenbacteria bacterium]|nr:GGDEF domain-containing protein [Candidatus Eisenbacteria bacterium]
MERDRPRAPRERRGDDGLHAVTDGAAVRERAAVPSGLERRRVSRSLWQACEALLSSVGDSRAVRRSLDQLRSAFDCDGVALYALGPGGAIEPWCARGLWRGTPGDLRDCISVPLLRGSERVGTLDLRARHGARWRPEQLGLVRTAAGTLGAALGARLELDRLRHQPGRDAVTGFPDARAFHARLTEEAARAHRHGVALAVVQIDLDHFAALNSRYGREVGDRALAEAALVLKLALRESDVIARLGGDGFAVLLPEADSAVARRCAERLCRTLEDHDFSRIGRLTASAGVAASPRDGVDPGELMHAADSALGVAKKSGRRRVACAAAANTH